MWFKVRPHALARMPSTRAQPFNPRAPEAPAGVSAAASALVAALFVSDEEAQARESAVQAGAFHESSYELRTGLEISESEWPEEVTIPAALGKD
ncbi:MAG TPA: hypothetical protein VFQ20_06655 [Burkholderiaceae bacterium]|nr:hypothetical protein [Burkholderiaceae bacterium]